MSTPEDDDIEFDFFDEPETVEAAQRRRLPRLEMPGGRGGDRPPRPPRSAPTGLVPLARLVGLIAIAIVVVVVLVLWISSCEGKSKQAQYRSYAAKVKAIASGDQRIGAKFASVLLTPAPKKAELASSLQQYASQEQQAYTQAQQIRPPGPLRAAHQNMINAIALRAKGLAGIGDTLAQAGTSAKTQARTVAALTGQGQLLTASDVVWAQLFRDAAKQQMASRGVKGVVIPSSVFVTNGDIVSSRSFSLLMQRLAGASTSGTPSGKHGSALVGVRVTPQGTDLSTSSATTIKVSSDLAFNVTFENSGAFAQVSVKVRLTIGTGGAGISRQKTVSLIQPGQQQTVTFTSFQLPASAFAKPVKVTATVLPVPGETNKANNSATYTVFFTLS